MELIYKIMDKKKLLRRFHAVCGSLNMTNEQKKEVVYSYGHESSKDMSESELLGAIENLQPKTKKMEMDLWRKRVFACIGAYLRRNGYDENAEMIKGIACRAAGVEKFSNIPKHKLVSVYNQFLKNNEVGRNVDNVKQELRRTNMN